jgi:hypothetical protein
LLGLAIAGSCIGLVLQASVTNSFNAGSEKLVHICGSRIVAVFVLAAPIAVSVGDVQFVGKSVADNFGA